MIRNSDLAEMAATQACYGLEAVLKSAEKQHLNRCFDSSLVVGVCILMAANLIADAIETASKES